MCSGELVGTNRVRERSSGSSEEKVNIESQGDVGLSGIDTALAPRSRGVDRWEVLATAASPVKFRAFVIVSVEDGCPPGGLLFGRLGGGMS